jgi:hypothetical protein
MEKLIGYNEFLKLFEGGSAIPQARRIKESEVKSTIDSIEKILVPLIGNGNIGRDYIIIGSVGKKKDPSATSGDIDFGIDKSFIERKFNIKGSSILSFLFDIVSKKLKDKLGFKPDTRIMKGINVVSVGWPIEGDINNGIVQLDLIPISDIKWAKYIFYSPDYKKGESKYKSAHRNWLFQAILSSMKEVLSKDENNEPETFNSYTLRLNDGVYKSKKTYKGIRKRLAKPKIISDSSSLVTNSPDKLIEILFGKGISPDDVKTFEDAWELVSSDNFKHKDKLGEIKDDFVRYLERGDYEIPDEIL